MKNLRKLLADEQGLVTIEWVGIAAVVVLAGIVISSYILRQTSDLGGEIAGKTTEVGTLVSGIDVDTSLDFTPSAGGTEE